MTSANSKFQIVLFIGACVQAPHFSIGIVLIPHLCTFVLNHILNPVMELMPQGSLYHVIHSDIELNLHRKFLMGRDIARGMHYLHSLRPSIVHRGKTHCCELLTCKSDPNIRFKELKCFG